MFRFGIISLLLIVVACAETTIRVKGLPTSEAQLALKKLAGRLIYVRNRPAAPSRADDAAFLLERHLILSGYRQVDVDWELPADGSILLTVTKGQRYQLGNVTIDNVPAENLKKHRDHFLHPFVQRQQTQQKSYPYLQEDFQAGVLNLRNYLRSEGYWEATVTASDPQFDAAEGVVNIYLREEAGTKHTLLIPTLKIEGAQAPELIAEVIGRLVGEPATAENINTLRATINHEFKNLGFPYLKVDMAQENFEGLTKLIFNINAGQRYRLGKVQVSGNKSTKERRIRRRFKDLQGKDFERDEIDARVRKLLGTGAFDRVEITESPQPGGVLDLGVEVDEAKDYGVKVYAGAGSLEGPIFGVGFFDRNLWKQLYNFEVELEFSGLGLLGEVSLTDPFFLERNLKWQNRAFIITRRFDAYEKFESGFESSLEWEVNRFYDVRFALGISYIDLGTRRGLPREELGNDDYLDSRLSLRQSYDRRNDTALPTKGYIAEMETAFGFALGNDSISYLSNELRYTWYHEINEQSRFALGGRLGIIQPLGNEERLPIDRRFFLGGANSVRSFPERELGPQVTGLPIGGRSYFVANAEYIHSLVGPLKGIAFLDAGSLTNDLDFGLNEVRYAAGLGVQLDLPIGPVRFEYGYALNRQEGDPSGAFHFAIGTAF